MQGVNATVKLIFVVCVCIEKQWKSSMFCVISPKCTGELSICCLASLAYTNKNVQWYYHGFWICTMALPQKLGRIIPLQQQ